ncbi:hypothetical protein BN7874_206 [Phage NCTB]|nr:hypothetical protein BN7874_206 [Phage NCTB]
MALEVGKGVYLQIKINDQELPPANNVFKELELHSGFGFNLPVAKLTLNDMHNFLSGGPYNLVDGTKVQLTFANDSDDNDPFEINCRVFGKVKTSPTNQGYTRTATLIPDLTEYTIEVKREARTGTSVAAIQEILGEHDIEVNLPESGLTTTDSMNWLNIGRTHNTFVHDIVSKAYTGDQTCVKGVLDWGNIFYLRDLFTEIQQEPQAGCYNILPVDEHDTKVHFRETSADTTSGFFNKLSNYGHTHVQHNLEGPLDIFEESNPISLGAGLPVNSEVQGSIDLTSLTAGKGFDSGCAPLGAYNMHEFYYDAQYLNMRHLSLFTESIRGLTDYYTMLPLLQCVQYDHTDVEKAGTVNNSAYTGKYVVGNRSVVIRESHYAEIYTLYRCYISEAGTTPVVDGATDTSGKTTPSAETAVNPSDPNNNSKAATQTNPNIKSVSSSDTEATELAKELGEYDADAEEQKGLLDSFNDFVQNQQDKLNSMLDDFKAQGQAFADENLADKYGEATDFIEAAGREFQSALKKLDDLCSSLIPSELAAIDLVGPDIGGFVGILADRVTSMDKLSKEFESGLNDMIDKGNIPSSYLNNPKISSKCSEIKEQLMDRVNTAELPNQCLDRLALMDLFLPQNTLARKLRLMENMINDLLCANGNGASANATINGPGISLTNT